MKQPKASLLSRVKILLSLGPIAGVGAVLIAVVNMIVICICELLWPREKIDLAEEWPYQKYFSEPGTFGDH